MPQVIFALLRSFASFLRPGLFKYLILPPLIGGGLWIVATFMWLGGLIDWLLLETPFSWVRDWLLDLYLGWLVTLVAFVGAWVILLAGAYLITVVIVGVWALPGIARVVAVNEYPDVVPRGKDSVVLSVFITLKAVFFYMVGWLLTLPLCLLPGVAIVHSFFWLAYLNRATFAFDALAAYVTPEEWAVLRKTRGRPFWMLGGLAALLAHIPFLGFFAPALASMAFVHYGLQALHSERGEAGNASDHHTQNGVIDGEFQRVSPDRSRS